MAITETELHDEESEVISWRRAALRRAGYDEESAKGLTRAGCPPEIAYRIFA